MDWETQWTFKTAKYEVRAQTTYDDDADLSWMGQQDLDDLQAGRTACYGVRVQVLKAGIVVGSDSLWGCVYRDIGDFFKEHRNADPMQRNCSIMRATRGDNVVIGMYFPDMVVGAIKEARATLKELAA